MVAVRRSPLRDLDALDAPEPATRVVGWGPARGDRRSPNLPGSQRDGDRPACGPNRGDQGQASGTVTGPVHGRIAVSPQKWELDRARSSVRADNVDGERVPTGSPTSRRCMFFLYRLLRNPSHPRLKWALATLLLALGVGLIVWGLLDHSPILAIRGAVELVIVGGFVIGVVRRNTQLRRGPGPSQLP